MDIDDFLKKLKELYTKLINSIKFPKGEKWNELWGGPWEKYGGCVPGKPAVYILWGSDSVRPLYIGQAKDFGKRLGEHFRERQHQWSSVQFITFEENTEQEPYLSNMMKLLERFAITVLNPVENKDC